MIKVGRTWLEDPIKLVESEVWDLVGDDDSPPFDTWEPRIDDDSRWYISREDGVIVGSYWAHRVNLITWECHGTVRPQFWGSKNGTAHCQACLDFALEDTGAKKMIATVADCFPEVQGMAESLGFRREGIRVASFQRGGKLYDEIYYGLNRNTNE